VNFLSIINSGSSVETGNLTAKKRRQRKARSRTYVKATVGVGKLEYTWSAFK
jgi:hypothetical protein